MTERVTPMIHVPDVQATVDWYRGIGFKEIETAGHDGAGISFAILSFGTTQVMFNEGGRPSTQRRREVDLYVYVDDVDEVYQRLKDRVEIVEGLHDTFYGMRELIIRDCNRFWITFGQMSTFGLLMEGVHEGKAESVRAALDAAAEKGSLKPERLTAALAAATAGDNQNAEIVELLKRAGAALPPELDESTLQAHTGHYRSEKGMEVEMIVKDGRLFAVPAGQRPITLLAVDEITFRPLAFEGVRVSFKVEDGRTNGFELRQGETSTNLQRIEL